MNEIVIQKMCKKSFEPVVKRIDQLLKEKFNLEPKIIAYQYSYLKK